jgi:oligopeptidase A
MAPWPGDKFLNQFRHLFYYGYDAGYYSYYWADIISADIHAAFAEAGMDNAAAMAEVGRRYR